jgi:hypothetical protein
VAKIQFICAAPHAVARGDGRELTITLYEGSWAYCLRGATDEHVWQHIEPTTVETIRAAAKKVKTIVDR